MLIIAIVLLVFVISLMGLMLWTVIIIGANETPDLKNTCQETKDKIEDATLEMTVRYNNGTDVKVRC